MPTMVFETTSSCPKNLIPVFQAAVKAQTGPFKRVSLVLGGLRPAHQTHRFLAGRKSPKGEIVADGDEKSQIVSFDATDVLAWLVASGFCRYEVQSC